MSVSNLINKILARFFVKRHTHEWILYRSVGYNQTCGQILLKTGSRLHKFCQICEKTGLPTKDELKNNPPIFEKSY